MQQIQITRDMEIVSACNLKLAATHPSFSQEVKDELIRLAHVIAKDDGRECSLLVNDINTLDFIFIEGN